VGCYNCSLDEAVISWPGRNHLAGAFDGLFVRSISPPIEPRVRIPSSLDGGEMPAGRLHTTSLPLTEAQDYPYRRSPLPIATQIAGLPRILLSGRSAQPSTDVVKEREQYRCYCNDAGKDFSLVERLSAKSRRLPAGTPTVYELLCAGKVLYESRFAAQKQSQANDLQLSHHYCLTLHFIGGAQRRPLEPVIGYPSRTSMAPDGR